MPVPVSMSTQPNQIAQKSCLELEEPIAVSRRPVWEGPESSGSQGGISQSLISSFLSCRERFRIKTIEGLSESEGFSAPLEYGNLWHSAEEVFANRTNANSADLFDASTDGDWVVALNEYAKKLIAKYSFDQEKVVHWHWMAMRQFPVYVQWWSQHPDMVKRTPLLSERVFKIPYRLPSGRTVYLRGKWDSVDLVEGGEQDGVWLQENKTKSGIDAQQITRQLTFDLQTSVYLTTLGIYGQPLVPDGNGGANHGEWRPTFGAYKLRGVRYNVIRRSAHKTPDSMMKKLVEDIQGGRAGEWFARWNVEITEQDIARFKTQCLDPVLENICDDYEWWEDCYAQGADPFDYKMRDAVYVGHRNRHFRLPYGVYQPIHQGGIDAVDRYMETGSDAGLVRVTELFPELKDETADKPSV
jgi:hypothetical protein